MIKKTDFRASWVTAAILVSSFGAEASEGVAQGKAGFHLFNPTPGSQMRDFSTDRPDKTESPYTVDAGHFQFETDLVNYSRDEVAGGAVGEGFVFNNINLKMGLLNDLDLQVMLENYKLMRATVGGTTAEEKGLGDATLRVKWNLLGNDGGPVALGLMPFVKIPTASSALGNGKVEGGLIFPVAVALPSDWTMGFMLQWNQMLNSSGSGYHAELVSSATVSRDILGDLGGYVELFSLASAEQGSEWVATADAGLTYGITPNLQLDAGVNVGLTEAADDLNPFLGISARF